MGRTRLRAIPAIVVSTDRSDNRVQRMLPTGSERGTSKKPFFPETLRDKLEDVFGGDRCQNLRSSRHLRASAEEVLETMFFCCLAGDDAKPESSGAETAPPPPLSSRLSFRGAPSGVFEIGVSVPAARGSAAQLPGRGKPRSPGSRLATRRSWPTCYSAPFRAASGPRRCSISRPRFDACP